MYMFLTEMQLLGNNIIVRGCHRFSTHCMSVMSARCFLCSLRSMKLVTPEGRKAKKLNLNCVMHSYFCQTKLSFYFAPFPRDCVSNFVLPLTGGPLCRSKRLECGSLPHVCIGISEHAAQLRELLQIAIHVDNTRGAASVYQFLTSFICF